MERIESEVGVLAAFLSRARERNEARWERQEKAKAEREKESWFDVPAPDVMPENPREIDKWDGLYCLLCAEWARFYEIVHEAEHEALPFDRPKMTALFREKLRRVYGQSEPPDTWLRFDDARRERLGRPARTVFTGGAR